MKKMLISLATLLMCGSFVGCSDDATPYSPTEETPLAVSELYSVSGFETSAIPYTTNQGVRGTFDLLLEFSDLEELDSSIGTKKFGETLIRFHAISYAPTRTIAASADEDDDSYESEQEFGGVYTYDEETGDLTYYFVPQKKEIIDEINELKSVTSEVWDYIDLTDWIKFDAKIVKNAAGQTVLHFDFPKFAHEVMDMPADITMTAPTEFVLEAFDVINEAQ